MNYFGCRDRIKVSEKLDRSPPNERVEMVFKFEDSQEILERYSTEQLNQEWRDLREQIVCWGEISEGKCRVMVSRRALNSFKNAKGIRLLVKEQERS